MEIVWQLKKFDELTLYELYQILGLRNEVFVVEQGCFYQDIDGKDLACHHLMGVSDDGALKAYTRIVPPGLSYLDVSIGRVITSASVRKNGIGKELLKRSLDSVTLLYGRVPIEISAQLYLKSFYESFGFRQVGDTYVEAGIAHIKMHKSVE